MTDNQIQLYAAACLALGDWHDHVEDAAQCSWCRECRDADISDNCPQHTVEGPEIEPCIKAYGPEVAARTPRGRWLRKRVRREIGRLIAGRLSPDRSVPLIGARASIRPSVCKLDLPGPGFGDDLAGLRALRQRSNP